MIIPDIKEYGLACIKCGGGLEMTDDFDFRCPKCKMISITPEVDYYMVVLANANGITDTGLKMWEQLMKLKDIGEV